MLITVKKKFTKYQLGKDLWVVLKLTCSWPTQVTLNTLHLVRQNMSASSSFADGVAFSACVIFFLVPPPDQYTLRVVLSQDRSKECKHSAPGVSYLLTEVFNTNDLQRNIQMSMLVPDRRC